MHSFVMWHPVVQAGAAGLFTWFITALGAATVFTHREMSRTFLDAMLGFAAGVMIAASFWSLLSPAIDLSVNHPIGAWFPAATGFLAGAALLRVADKVLPHLHPLKPITEAEGIKTHLRQTTLLVLAITLHNIPEGLAIGVAFGAAAHAAETGSGATLAGAIALALGIGLQNFPEGLAVSMPLRRIGVKPFKSFWYGQLSAAVEPVAAVVGAAAVLLVQPLLPYALSFAAGAMIFVVVEELIPESQQGGNTDLATLGSIVGFTVMMILDVALGLPNASIVGLFGAFPQREGDVGGRKPDRAQRRVVVADQLGDPKHAGQGQRPSHQAVGTGQAAGRVRLFVAAEHGQRDGLPVA